jgi:hypothetical protein
MIYVTGVKKPCIFCKLCQLEGHVKIDEIVDNENDSHKAKKGLINQYYQANLWRENQYHNTY